MDTKTTGNPATTILSEENYFRDLRVREFARLDEAGQCYLDYTGGNLYPKSLLERHFSFLKDAVYGNPHSGNPTSELSTGFVQSARQKVIEFFNADDYFCVFTANASSALHTIGECYPFDEKSRFLLTADNHNSVNGIREYCKNKKGTVEYSRLNVEDLKINRESLETALNAPGDFSHKLFAYPAQSNVSGIKHDLSWISYAQEHGWDVLLDAAAFVPTSPLDLKKIQPEFVVMSFYKIFGYPTGLGCLLVRKDKFDILKKPWFAGGTVSLVSVHYQDYSLARNHERFENGTVDYLGIPAIQFGLEFVENIGMERIKARVQSLTKYLVKNLEKLTHSNGKPIVHLYACSDLENKGGTVILNFHDQNEQIFDFEEVEKRANKKNISIRTGCFCNPGIDEINNCITTDELSTYFTSRSEYEYHDMITFLGKMRGAIRISIGLPTVQTDLDKFIRFVKTFRDTTV